MSDSKALEEHRAKLRKEIESRGKKVWTRDKAAHAKKEKDRKIPVGKKGRKGASTAAH